MRILYSRIRGIRINSQISVMLDYDHDHDNEVIPFAETNFRKQRRRFGIKTDDRRRHVYVLGKTGMGKTTMLENMVLSDINAGHGVGVVDPHGDFAEKILDFIPSSRINDVVYFNPADTEYPIGFNVLEAVNETHKHLVASGLMGVFKKIWPDVWSARMEHILNNCILALLEYPGSTLLGINRLLVDKEFRRRVVSAIKDPIVKSFWLTEYNTWEPKFLKEAIAPIQNKVGQFLSASIIRNIVAQVKSTINPREMMDEGKIFIMNLAKGRIGEDSSRLLGGMLITKIQLAAMERVDIPERERRDFYLYVDEFQNFATQSFANILSEARKYRLNLIIAHQYIEQLDEEYVRPAVFGNVGTIICFRVGAKDGEFLENEFAPTFTPTDLVNLTKFDTYLKLMIDGVSSSPFSAQTLPPIQKRTGNAEKVIKVSRERHSEPRASIEEKILRWTGMAPGEETREIEAMPGRQEMSRPFPPPIRTAPAQGEKEKPPRGEFAERFPKARVRPAFPKPQTSLPKADTARAQSNSAQGGYGSGAKPQASKPRIVMGLKEELAKGSVEVLATTEKKDDVLRREEKKPQAARSGDNKEDNKRQTKIRPGDKIKFGE